MREIKFRAWDNSTREMVSSKQLGDQTWNVLSSLQRNDCNWTFMQYTGLKDKNGKEIYEGDILKNVAVQNSDSFVVDWANDQEYCGFVARAVNQKIGELFINKNFLNCEIISNIYENPELKN